MRFMVMVPATQETEAGKMPDQKTLAEMGKFNEEMVKAGVLLAGEGLHPTSKGARIRFSGGTTAVMDGPFTESKELIAGFWLIQVKSKDEAIAWMRRAPFPDGVVLELRQVFEAEDFGEAFTPELREQEARTWAQAAQNARG
ncbi:MAG TPA: YciI family protein [Chloroflexota bacterium]|nr:YciI family protein [Chloroflexota bacterium]